MVAIKNILLLATSVTAAVVQRAASTVYSDLVKLDGDVNQLNADVAVGSINSFAIAADVDTVEGDVTAATANAAGSPEIVGADADRIYNYLSTTALHDVSAAIETLVSRKTIFIASLLGGVVLLDLRTLRSETATYLATLSETIPSYADEIDNLASGVDTSFALAIQAYSA